MQGTQKTEAGNTGMDVSMVTKTATTYLGGGNLSWQAIEFSDPSAFDLWFRADRRGLRAEDGDGRGNGRVGVGVPEQHRVARSRRRRRSRS